MKRVFLQMLYQYCRLSLVLILIIVCCASCAVNGQHPTSYSFEGAVVETGYRIDDQNDNNGKLRMISPQTTFEVNEDFYFLFFNNEPFGEDEVIVELINSDTGEIKAENIYPVDPEGYNVFDMIWFNSPGMKKISVKVGDQVRATQEVFIE